MTDPVAIRSAQPADALYLSSIALRSKAHWGYSKQFMAACEAELRYTTDDIAAENMHFRLAICAARIVGFYALRKLGNRRFQLEALFVEPEHIGAGIGRDLLRHALDAVAQTGGGRVMIESDPHAGTFYEAVGGIQTGSVESGSIPGRFLPVFEISVANHSSQRQN